MKKRRFRANNQYYNIPEAEVDSFKVDFPDAIEVKMYDLGGKTYNIPLDEIDAFETDMGLKKKDAGTVSKPAQSPSTGGAGKAGSSVGLSGGSNNKPEKDFGFYSYSGGTVNKMPTSAAGSAGAVLKTAVVDAKKTPFEKVADLADKQDKTAREIFAIPGQEQPTDAISQVMPSPRRAAILSGDKDEIKRTVSSQLTGLKTAIDAEKQKPKEFLSGENTDPGELESLRKQKKKIESAGADAIQKLAAAEFDASPDKSDAAKEAAGAKIRQDWFEMGIPSSFGTEKELVDLEKKLPVGIDPEKYLDQLDEAKFPFTAYLRERYNMLAQNKELYRYQNMATLYGAMGSKQTDRIEELMKTDPVKKFMAGDKSEDVVAAPEVKELAGLAESVNQLITDAKNLPDRYPRVKSMIQQESVVNAAATFFDRARRGQYGYPEKLLYSRGLFDGVSFDDPIAIKEISLISGLSEDEVKKYIGQARLPSYLGLTTRSFIDNFRSTQQGINRIFMPRVEADIENAIIQDKKYITPRPIELRKGNVNIDNILGTAFSGVGQVSAFALEGYFGGRVLGVGGKVIDRLSRLTRNERLALSTAENALPASNMGKVMYRLGLADSEAAGLAKYKSLLQKAHSASGTFAAGKFSSYEDAYQEAGKYTTDEKERHKYAAAVSNANGLSELILNDADYAAKILKKSPGVDALEAFRKGKTPFSSKNVFAARMAEFSKVIGYENLEELMPALEEVSKKMELFDYETPSKEFWDTIVNTALVTTATTVPMAATGAARISPSRYTKDNLYQIGLQPEKYIGLIDQMRTDGKLTDDQATAGKETVSRMEAAVKALPPSLSEDQKAEVAYAIAAKEVISEEKKNAPSALKPILAEQENNIQEQVNNILSPKPQEDGKEKGQEKLLTKEGEQQKEAQVQPAADKAAAELYQQPFSTSRGKFKVEYNEGKRVVKTSRGKVVPETIKIKEKVTSGPNRGAIVQKEVANPQYNRVLLQHAKQYNYNVGETAATKEKPVFENANEAETWTIENSQNPAEIAATWLQSEKLAQPLSSVEMAIARAGVGKVKKESFTEFNDRNNITASLAKTYFNKNGRSLDQVAQAASNYDEEVQVTPEDVAQFMVNYPFGIDPDAKVKTSVHQMAEEKFMQLTGIPLDPGNGRSVVARMAASQYVTPEQKQAAAPRAEQMIESMPAEEIHNWLKEMVEINTDDDSVFSDFKPDNYDQYQTEDPEANSGGPGGQPNTEQPAGGKTAAGNGTNGRPGADTGGPDTGGSDTTGDPGRTAGAGADSGTGSATDGGGKSESPIDVLRREISEADQTEEEQGPSFQADPLASQLKAAVNNLEKARRELSKAEDKIAGTQSSQAGMFGTATQGSMFSVDREEATGILGPLRENVKKAAEEVEKIKTRLAVEQSKANGQGTLFDAEGDYVNVGPEKFNRVVNSINTMFAGTPGFMGVSVLEESEFYRSMENVMAEARFNFVGGKARFKAAMEARPKAEELESQGVDNETIYRQTGWYKDMLDGEWKYELPNNSKLKPLDWLKPGESKIVPIEFVLDYPELYEAYPEAKNIKIVFTEKLPDDTYASYGENGKSKTIFINNNADFLNRTGGGESIARIYAIRHEVQHFIQKEEGFARGASSGEDGLRKVAEFVDSRKSKINELRGVYEKGGVSSAVAAQIEEEIYLYEDQIADVENDPAGAAEFFYLGYAGEIEARNIEKRISEDKPQGSPNTTADKFPPSFITVDKFPKFMSRPDGNIYGFVYKGIVHLNGKFMNVNTPIHEASHLFSSWAKDNAPDLYEAGKRLASSSVYMNRVKSMPFYQQQADQMRQRGKTDAQINDFFADEALAFSVGDRGAAIVIADKRSAFQQFLSKLWNAVKRLFVSTPRIENMTADQFSKMSFDQFSELAAQRIISGESLAESTAAQSESTLADPAFMATPTTKGGKLQRAVQKALATGLSEDDVKNELTSSGYSEIIAENIIQNAKRLPVYKPISVQNNGNAPALTPANNIAFTGEKGWYQKAKESFKNWGNKYFSINKGMPEWMLPLGEKTAGVQNLEVQKAYQTIKQLKSVAKKIGFNDWDQVDAALRDMQQPSIVNATILSPAGLQHPSVVSPKLLALPNEIIPIVVKMRAQIDGLSRDLITNGYVTPEQALVIEENIGQYMTRAYRAYNEKGWAKKVPANVKDSAANFLYKHYYATIKAAAPSIPEADAMAQAEEMALKRVQSILDGIDSEYGPQKIKTVKGRDNAILTKREDIPEEIRQLLGEYTDPGQAFMMTISKMATLRSQAEFLASVREMGLGSIFFEKDDPARPQEASVELRGPSSSTWYPLGGLYTTPYVAEHFNEAENLRNSLLQMWMNFVGAVRWGKTVGSVVTQIKNFESNLGFAIMNGHFSAMKSGDSFAYLWDKMKWWNGDRMDSKVIDDAAKQGLIGQNVGVRELKDMFNTSNTRKIIAAAATNKESVIKRISRAPGQTVDYLNKIYAASDDFFKIYGFVSERSILANSRFGQKYEELDDEKKSLIDDEAAERVKNTYPTYDRVWDGPRFVSKNMPIFGNFLSFQAESIRVLLNTFNYAITDLKDPQMRSAGARRMVGIMSYLATRYAILKAVSMLTGYSMSAFFGGGSDDEEQKLTDINRFVLPFMRSGEKLVIQNGPGRYTVYDMTSLEPYGLWFKTINAIRSGTENNQDGGALAAISEFLGPFGEEEMTFETFRQIQNNDNGRGGNVYPPDGTIGDKAKSIIGFAWKKLQPSTIGFIDRMISRDNKANEVAAMFGGRGYDLDVSKAFSIKIYQAEEVLATINHDFFQAISKAKTDEEKVRIGQEADKRKNRLLTTLREDYLSAIRLGADQETLDKRLEKADKKFIDVWSSGDIMMIWSGDGESTQYEDRARKQ